MQQNKPNTTLTHKKALTIAIALLMTVLGSLLIVTYSNPVIDNTLVKQGNVNINANDYYIIACPVEKDGAYMVKVDIDKGPIQIYGNYEYSTLVNCGNGTSHDVRSSFPIYNGTSNEIAASMGGDTPWTEYFILSNSDAYTKNVDYRINYRIEYTNYNAIIAGVALTTFGITLLILSLIKSKPKETNNP